MEARSSETDAVVSSTIVPCDSTPESISWIWLTMVSTTSVELESVSERSAICFLVDSTLDPI